MTPDWKKLRAANQELERLKQHGLATHAEWDRILGEAKAAVGDHTEYLEGILMTGAELGFVKS